MIVFAAEYVTILVEYVSILVIISKTFYIFNYVDSCYLTNLKAINIVWSRKILKKRSFV